MEWTDETIARLRDLWGQGLSTAEIGRQLSITKNAVVGKAHRLGLPPRPSPIRNRKDGEGDDGAPEVTPRRKSPPRPKPVAEPGPDGQPAVKGKAADRKVSEKTLPPEAFPDKAVADKASVGTDAKAAVTAAPTPKVATAEFARSVAAPRPAVVSAPAPEPVAVRQDDVVPPRPEPQVAPVSRPAPPPRFSIAGIDRPTRRGPSCCWPIGDPGTPGFHFCGATPLTGKPYCAEHAAIAYVKIRDRRD